MAFLNIFIIFGPGNIAGRASKTLIMSHERHYAYSPVPFAPSQGVHAFLLSYNSRLLCYCQEVIQAIISVQSRCVLLGDLGEMLFHHGLGDSADLYGFDHAVAPHENVGRYAEDIVSVRNVPIRIYRYVPLIAVAARKLLYHRRVF